MNRQHPCAEQEPEYWGYRLANAGNSRAATARWRAGDGQLLPLTLREYLSLMPKTPTSGGVAPSGALQLFRQGR